MSGGAFDYKQHFIEYMADEIEQRILNSGRKIPQEVLQRDPWIGYWADDFDAPRYYPQYNRKTIDIMKRAVYVLRMAYIYAQRVDWMLSGDDGEDSLVERLEKELAELKKKYHQHRDYRGKGERDGRLEHHPEEHGHLHP